MTETVATSGARCVTLEADHEIHIVGNNLLLQQNMRADEGSLKGGYMTAASFIAFCKTLAQKVFVSFLAKRIDATCTWLWKKGVPMPRFMYIRQLKEFLRAMPFIYQDLDMNVLEDFVDVNAESYDATSPSHTTQKPEFTNKQIAVKLGIYKRGIILGDGGMGKTTVFRYMALSAITKQSETTRIFEKEENLVPVFVSLKALDISQPLPIGRAIAQECQYFSTRGGDHRLRS